MLRTSHWDRPKVLTEEDLQPVVFSDDPPPGTQPDAPLDASTLPKKKVEPTEKAVGAPLIGIGVGFALLGPAPPVGAAILALSSAWMLYKSV